MKNNSVLTTCFALFGLCTCVVCGIGFYLYYQWGRISPPSPPNVFVIDKGMKGPILIVSRKSNVVPVLGIQEFALNTDFEVLPTAFSANSGRWIAKQGTKTYEDLSALGKPPSQVGIWSIGPITSTELQDYQIFELYIGTAKDAQVAESGIGIQKTIREVTKKLVANHYLKAP